MNNPVLVSRFLRESEIIAGLEHPNILPIYDVGEEEGSLFLIMKFIQGKSLAQMIDYLNTVDREKITLKDLSQWLVEGISHPEERHQLPGHNPLEFYLSIMEKVSEAVQFAHSRGVAHRDIKPSNIIIQPDGNPVLLDFGLAWVEKEQDITVDGEFLGTPVYSAPESFRKPSPENHFLLDVYSLGITSYELVTGNLPYEGESLVEIYANLKTKEPKSPKAYWKDIPGDLETILLKAIAKDPGYRYASVQEFHLDLTRFLHDQPINARPPPWWQRMVYFLKRNYRWEIPVALGLLAIVAVGFAARSARRLSHVEAERAILQTISELLEAKREKAAQILESGKRVLKQTEQNLFTLTLPREQNPQALREEIKILETQLIKDPNDVRLMENVAGYALALNDLAMAEAMARAILAQIPQDYLAHHILANIYIVQRQEMEKAKALVRDFNRYYPEEAKLNGLLGTQCLVLRHYNCAKEFLTLASLQNPPKYGEFLIAAQMALGNFEEARRLYEVGTEYYPDHPEYLEGLAVTLAKLERFDEAKAAAEKSLALDPDNPRVEKLLRAVEAQIYFDQQQKQEVQAHAKIQL